MIVKDVTRHLGLSWRKVSLIRYVLHLIPIHIDVKASDLLVVRFVCQLSLCVML